jgi:hypothetical protein
MDRLPEAIIEMNFCIPSEMKTSPTIALMTTAAAGASFFNIRHVISPRKR